MHTLQLFREQIVAVLLFPVPFVVDAFEAEPISKTIPFQKHTYTSALFFVASRAKLTTIQRLVVSKMQRGFHHIAILTSNSSIFGA